MNNLTKFQNRAINLNETANVKGGIFCEWYINQRTAAGEEINDRHMQRAMRLDAIVDRRSLEVAMRRGGARFMSRFS